MVRECGLECLRRHVGSPLESRCRYDQPTDSGVSAIFKRGSTDTVFSVTARDAVRAMSLLGFDAKNVALLALAESNTDADYS